MFFKILFTTILLYAFNTAFGVTMEFNVENSELLYKKNCSSCHMQNLSGHPKWKTKLDADGHRQPLL